MNKHLLIIILWCLLTPGVYALSTDKLNTQLRTMAIKSLGDITTGSLVVQTSKESQLLPLMDTQVSMTIQGLVAQTQVTQFFENPTQHSIEASYYYPLPEDSSVSKMHMRIGERLILGEIKEKVVAEKIYAAAKRSGKRTALVEQGRPNLFRSKVANIAPGETIEVTLLYHQPVMYRQGEFSIRFPSTLTPRYTPAVEKTLTETFLNKNAGIQIKADEIVHSIPPPVSAEQRSDHQISIDVNLNAGFPLASIRATNHAIVSKKIAKGHYRIGLQNYQVNDRDFELVWQVVPAQEPRLMIFDELDTKDPDFLYSQIVLMPPAAENFTAIPREVTFILDHSGSMEGLPMQQAKQAMLEAIRDLDSNDRFNVVGFNNTHRSLFGGPVNVEAGSKGWAMAYIQDLDAEGGTEMLPALKEALLETTSDNYVRQVMFLTDGAVSNEDALFQLIHDSLGEARLFTVGIGSAPNSYFMRKAAQYGRGSFTFINNKTEVSRKMQQLLEQLRYPAMHSLVVEFSETVSVYPEELPDLYQGEPLVLIVRRPATSTDLTLNGQRLGTAWQATINLAGVSKQPAMGIGQLWAKAKIQQLIDQQRISAQPDIHRDEVIALALLHQILTPYTSFVAVEQVVSRATEDDLKSHAIPNLIPHGAEHFAYPATAIGWQGQLLFGLSVLLLVRLLSAINWSWLFRYGSK